MRFPELRGCLCVVFFPSYFRGVGWLFVGGCRSSYDPYYLECHVCLSRERCLVVFVVGDLLVEEGGGVLFDV